MVRTALRSRSMPIGLLLAVILILPAWPVVSSAQDGSSSGAIKALSLEEAVRKALLYHPSVKARGHEAGAASYGTKAMRGQRWLKADLVAQAERNSDPVAVTSIKGPGAFPEFSRDIYLWNLNLSLPIYEGGRTRRQVEIGELKKKIQESLLEQTAQDLLANVKQTYFQILYLEELAEAQERLVENLRRQRDAAERRYRLGRTARVDLYYFDRALEEEKAALDTTRENLRLARRLLAIYTGMEGEVDAKGSLLEGTSVWIDPADPIQGAQDAVDQEGVDERPDVKAADLRLRQSERALELARRSYLPTVSAFSSYGRRAGSGLHYDEEVWIAGLRFDINLFDSGVKRNKVRESESLMLAARRQAEAARLRAVEEISRAKAMIETAKARIASYDAALAYAKEAYRVERLRYENGASSINDLLAAHDALLRAESQLSRARYDLTTAYIAYELACGKAAEKARQIIEEAKGKGLSIGTGS